MSIYSGARAADVRALSGAIVLGSSVGLMLGGAYLLAGPKPSAIPGVGVMAQAALPAGASPAAVVRVSALAPKIAGVTGLAASLRDRLGLNPSARPFAFARVASTSTDLHCLAETVYFEARGEPADGQKAVAQVVLNRVRHPAFPKTICAVVHQRTAGGCQFSFACSGREAATDSVAWRRAESVASAALHGAVMAAVGDATHFQAVRLGSFAGLMKVAQIGAHAFYRFAGHQGAASMFRQAPSPSDGAGSVKLAELDLVRPDPPELKALPDVHNGGAKVTSVQTAVQVIAPRFGVTAVKLGAASDLAVRPVALPAPATSVMPAPAAKAVVGPAAKPMAALALAQS